MKFGKTNQKNGFTMVELMLSMVFLAVLMMTIAVLVMHVVSTYQKGLAIRAVNATGRALIDDFSRSVAASPYSDIQDDYSFITGEFITGSGMKKYYMQTPGTGGVPLHGVFCTGLFSYIWNTGYALNDARSANDYSNTLRYRYSMTDEPESNFKLIKVPDRERLVCYQYATFDSRTICRPDHYNMYDNTCMADPRQDSGDRLDFAPLELLDSSEDELAIYDFKVFPATQNPTTHQTFYTATFILATLRGGVDIFTRGNYCEPGANDLNTDFNYCSINKFNFAMRATGENEVPVWEYQ